MRDLIPIVRRAKREREREKRENDDVDKATVKGGNFYKSFDVKETYDKFLSP
jgi:hypothetical protein